MLLFFISFFLKRTQTKMYLESSALHVVFPILQGQFDQCTSNGDILFDFTDKQNIECPDPASVILGSRRPNGRIGLVAGHENRHLGYTEVKSFSVARNHYKINVGLARLAIFGKNVVDNNRSQDVMAIQAVGMSMIFHIIQKTADKIYPMSKLEHIRFPSSIDEMAMMLGIMDKLMDIIVTLRTHRLEASLLQAVFSKEALKSPVLRAITTATASRKRKNYHQLNHF
ncbi:unnamed protein product [Rhizopus microsporus]